jgi:hypothetical protein
VGRGGAGDAVDALDALRPLGAMTAIDATRFPVPRRPYAPAPGGRVIHVTTTGSPSGDGSTGSPFGALQLAVNAAHPGDVVLVAGGNYSLDAVENYGLTITTRNLIVTAREGEHVQVTSVGGQKYGIYLAGDDVVLDGFELIGFRNAGIYFGRTSSTQRNAQILRTTVNGGVDGIRSVVTSGTGAPVVAGLLLYQVRVFGAVIGFNCGEGPCNDVRLEQITVRGSNQHLGNSGSDAVAFEHGANLAVVDADLSGQEGDGLDTKADGALALNVNAHDLDRNGIKMWRGGDIINSLVVNTGADTAISFANGGHYRVLNTTVANHAVGRPAYSLSAAYDHQDAGGTLEVANCIFFKNSGPIFVPASFAVTFRNNIFFGAEEGSEVAWGTHHYGPAFEPISALEQRGGGSGNLGYVDPNLTAPDSGAFGLRSGSSAVDHGVMLAALPAFDLSGATRVAGAAIDLGPYESR